MCGINHHFYVLLKKTRPFISLIPLISHQAPVFTSHAHVMGLLWLEVPSNTFSNTLPPKLDT